MFVLLKDIDPGCCIIVSGEASVILFSAGRHASQRTYKLHWMDARTANLTRASSVLSHGSGCLLIAHITPLRFSRPRTEVEFV